jgi:hypothetical protein
MLGYPSRSAAFTRADTARGEEDPSSSYTPETSLLNARKTFPKQRRVLVEEDEKDEKRAKGEQRRHRPTRLTSDPTSIVIRALEVHRLRSEKLKREKTEKVRLEREREKKRLADAQRAATLGKIQKVKEELNLTTTTTTQKRRGDVGGSIAEEKEEEAKAKEAAAVAASSRKRRDEGEAERAKGGGENPFARGNKKAKKGGKKGKK